MRPRETTMLTRTYFLRVWQMKGEPREKFCFQKGISFRQGVDENLVLAEGVDRRLLHLKPQG
jgi:hypothetical protein